MTSSYRQYPAGTDIFKLYEPRAARVLLWLAENSKDEELRMKCADRLLDRARGRVAEAAKPIRGPGAPTAVEYRPTLSDLLKLNGPTLPRVIDAEDEGG